MPELSDAQKEKLGQIYLILCNSDLSVDDKKAAFLKYVDESGHRADLDSFVADLKARVLAIKNEKALSFAKELMAVYNRGEFFIDPTKISELYKDKHSAAGLSAEDDAALAEVREEFKSRFEKLFFVIFPLQALAEK